MDVPPPVPKHRSQANSHQVIPLRDCEWYWASISREEANAKLKDTADGTFLVRDSQQGACTIILRYSGRIKMVRVTKIKEQFTLSSYLKTFDSVADLITYYHNNSLYEFHPSLDVKLKYPISRFTTMEAKEGSVTELLELLRDVSKQFDIRNETHVELLDQLQEIKKKITATQSTINGSENIVQLLNEQVDIIKYSKILAMDMSDEDRKKAVQSVKLLMEKLVKAEDCHRQAVKILSMYNNYFSEIDQKVNTSRPILMKLQQEKDHYTSMLIQKGVTHHEIFAYINEKVSIAASCDSKDSEGLYGTLYKVLDCPHVKQETWYIAECDRATAESLLKGKPNGTFLCRPSKSQQQSSTAVTCVHSHTIDIMYYNITHIRILQDTSNKYYGVTFPCQFENLVELVMHYKVNSLGHDIQRLEVNLAYPIYSLTVRSSTFL